MTGKQVQITSRKNFAEQHPDSTGLLPPVTGGLECVVLIDKAYAATLQFRDEVRADSFIVYQPFANLTITLTG